MGGKPTVIYAARTLQEAHLLKNALSEAGIEGQVINSVLEGGAGVDIVGWPTLARVVVAEQDAQLARQLALQLERKLRQPGAGSAAELPEAAAAQIDDSWPICPQCGARRTTICSACHTAGTHFVLADPAPDAAADVQEAGQPVEAPSSDPMRICPTCDEPFTPEYLRRCEWCGHDFRSGLQEYGLEEAPKPIDSSMLVAILVVLVAAAIGLVVYWTYAS